MKRINFDKLTQSQTILCGQSIEYELACINDCFQCVTTIGEKLQIRMPVVGVAMAYIHLASFKNSFLAFNRLMLATAALYVACKSEYCPIRIEILIIAYWEFDQDRNRSLNPYATKTKATNYSKIHPRQMERLKESLQAHELWMLHEINFELNIDLPYGYIQTYVQQQQLKEEEKSQLVDIANKFANESWKTRACLIASSEAISQACLYLACKFLKLELNIQISPSSENVIKLMSFLYDRNLPKNSKETLSFSPSTASSESSFI